jgi:UDP-N-acetylglucosamine 2-epimerase (non-hydrolysing)/GDP/UDP-N,N'-diacetylbacillosamine 2-epimerase (hydrolysing)
MKKILAITGIRSDYDLMSSLYRKLSKTPEIDFQLLVGGAHMSQTYGHSIDLIRADGIKTLLCIESLIDGDSSVARLKTASIMLQGVIDSVASWRPDLIIYAGDREEVWIGALLGAYLEVPTVHFYGGDHTITGHVDNPVRHAVSKLSTAHFVATLEHKERLLAMGEDAQRIFVTGSLALDNFVEKEPLPISILNERLQVDLPDSGYAIALFHPDPSEKSVAGQYMVNIIEATINSGIFVCIGYPNSDPASRDVINAIEKFRGHASVHIYKNLTRDDFIGLYKSARFIIGNSSSGIIEAASIPLPVINVGLRQRGRHAGLNVIFSDGDIDAIQSAIHDVQTEQFRNSLRGLVNPYGDGKSAKRALKILLDEDFNRNRLKVEDPLVTKLNKR